MAGVRWLAVAVAAFLIAAVSCQRTALFVPSPAQLAENPGAPGGPGLPNATRNVTLHATHQTAYAAGIAAIVVDDAGRRVPFTPVRITPVPGPDAAAAAASTSGLVCVGDAFGAANCTEAVFGDCLQYVGFRACPELPGAAVVCSEIFRVVVRPNARAVALAPRDRTGASVGTTNPVPLVVGSAAPPVIVELLSSCGAPLLAANVTQLPGRLRGTVTVSGPWAAGQLSVPTQLVAGAVAALLWNFTLAAVPGTVAVGGAQGPVAVPLTVAYRSDDGSTEGSAPLPARAVNPPSVAPVHGFTFSPTAAQVAAVLGHKVTPLHLTAPAPTTVEFSVGAVLAQRTPSAAVTAKDIRDTAPNAYLGLALHSHALTAVMATPESWGFDPLASGTAGTPLTAANGSLRCTTGFGTDVAPRGLRSALLIGPDALVTALAPVFFVERRQGGAADYLFIVLLQLGPQPTLRSSLADHLSCAVAPQLLPAGFRAVLPPPPVGPLVVGPPLTAFPNTTRPSASFAAVAAALLPAEAPPAAALPALRVEVELLPTPSSALDVARSVLSAAFVVNPDLAFLSAVVHVTDCTADRGAPMDMALHPLQLTLTGDVVTRRYVGALVCNAVLIAAAFLFPGLLGLAVRMRNKRRAAQTDTALPTSVEAMLTAPPQASESDMWDFVAAKAFPHVGLVAAIALYPGTTLAGAGVVASTGSSFWLVAWCLGGVAYVVLFPLLLFRVAVKMAPGYNAVNVRKSSIPWYEKVLAPLGTYHTPRDRVERLRAAYHEFRGPHRWVLLPRMAVWLATTALAADFMPCRWRFVVPFVVSLPWSLFLVTRVPYITALHNALAILAAVATLISMALLFPSGNERRMVRAMSGVLAAISGATVLRLVVVNTRLVLDFWRRRTVAGTKARREAMLAALEMPEVALEVIPASPHFATPPPEGPVPDDDSYVAESSGSDIVESMPRPGGPRGGRPRSAPVNVDSAVDVEHLLRAEAQGASPKGRGRGLGRSGRLEIVAATPEPTEGPPAGWVDTSSLEERKACERKARRLAEARVRADILYNANYLEELDGSPTDSGHSGAALETQRLAAIEARLRGASRPTAPPGRHWDPAHRAARREAMEHGGDLPPAALDAPLALTPRLTTPVAVEALREQFRRL